jgi:hypothetical protein
MNQRLSNSLPLGAAFAAAVIIGLVLTLPGGSSATAWAQSPQPTPTATFTPGPIPPSPTPTNTPDLNAPTATPTPVLPTPTNMPTPSTNQPPVCSDARPSRAILWLPNHRFRPIRVLSVTDPDGDDFEITIDSISQDEAVDAPGSGHTSPDGRGVGMSTAWVRAERVDGGNGRVYHIGFTADDGRGGACSGEALVGVPQYNRDVPVDDGAQYDSTALTP